MLVKSKLTHTYVKQIHSKAHVHLIPEKKFFYYAVYTIFPENHVRFSFC